MSFEIRDISVPLNAGLPIWPGSSGIRLEWVKRMESGQDCNASVLHCDVHAGTHVDAPLHHLANGEDVTKLNLDALCGTAIVVPCEGNRLIGARELEALEIPSDCRRLLLRTDNSQIWESPNNNFNGDYCALSEDGAIWITQRKMLLVGTDYLSIQPFSRHPNVHSILLKAGVVILEGINLIDVEYGWWDLVCLPLLLSGAEGSPARAILRRPINGA